MDQWQTAMTSMEFTLNKQNITLSDESKNRSVSMATV
jgi:hypothetical protein